MKAFKKIVIGLTVIMLTISIFACKQDKDEEKTNVQSYENVKTSMKFMEKMYNDTSGENMNFEALQGVVYSAYPDKLQGIVNTDLNANELKLIGYSNNSSVRGSSKYANWYEGVNLDIDTLKDYLSSEQGIQYYIVYNSLLKAGQTRAKSEKSNTSRGWGGKVWKSVKKHTKSALKAAPIIGSSLLGFGNVFNISNIANPTIFDTTINNTFNTDINVNVDLDGIKDAVADGISEINGTLNTQMGNLTGAVGTLTTSIDQLSANIDAGFAQIGADLAIISGTTVHTDQVLTQFVGYATEQFNSLHQGQENMLTEMRQNNDLINANLNALLFDTYSIIINQKSEDFEDSKKSLSNFIKSIGLLEGLDDIERADQVSVFIKENSIALFDDAYKSAKDTHAFKKEKADQHKSEGDYYLSEYDLIMPSADMLFFKEFSLLRLSLSSEVYSGDDLLEYNSKHASEDLVKVLEMKDSINNAYTIFMTAIVDPAFVVDEEFASKQEQIDEYINYFCVIMGKITSWEIQLRAHMAAYEDSLN